MRLYTFLKDEFNLTKSEVTIFFTSHKVLVNDKECELTTKINELSSIKIDDKVYKIKDKDYIYIALNKPRGYECTNDKKNTSSILNLIDIDLRVFCVGRLDKDSEGLIILTNDGAFSNQVLSPNHHVEKEYIVSTKEKIDNAFIENISRPQKVLNKITKPCKAYLIDDYTFKIILTEGINRQIRRMTKNLGHTVISLKRIRFGNLKLDIEEKKYKFVKKEEII